MKNRNVLEVFFWGGGGSIVSCFILAEKKNHGKGPLLDLDIGYYSRKTTAKQGFFFINI